MSGMMPSSALMRGGMKSCWRYPHSSRHESCAPHPTQLAACSQSAFRPRTARADVRTAQTFALQFIWCVRCRSDFNSLGRRQRILNIDRSEEHTSELQSLMRISYAVFCLKNKKKKIKD